MKHIGRCMIVVLILLVVPCAHSATDFVWVTSSEAKMKSEKSAASDTIATLPLGTKLEVIKFESRWFHVTGPDGKMGWVYRGKVSRTAPTPSSDKGDGNQLGTLLGGLSGSKIGSDTPDTSRSIRALEADKSVDNQEASGQGDAQKALERVLTFRVLDQEIEQFLEAGGIGEYAR